MTLGFVFQGHGVSMSTVDVESAAEELYALPPGEFTAARDGMVKEARAAGEKDVATAVGRLRKPSTAAWVVNLLARYSPEELDGLLALGDALREAQAGLAGDELRALGRQRQQVVAALSRRGRALAAEAGQKVSGSVDDEVQATLSAALAEPDAAAHVRAGRLTTALAYQGLGLPTGASSPPASGPASQAPAKKTSARDELARRRARQEAERAVREATGAVEEARAAVADGAAAAEEAERRQTAAAADVERLTRELEGARTARDEAHRDLGAARKDADVRARALAKAEHRLAQVTRQGS